MPFDDERSRVAHLLRRAGFGYTPAELDEYTALGFQGALDRLLNPERIDNSALDLALASAQIDVTRIEGAKYWWLTRMLNTRRPLEEKIALFWHNHFATAASKVPLPALMLQQIQLFRDRGLGSFETLLQQVTRDPAMLIWLDNRQNRKQAPNENYGREVMELFTIGVGNYTDDDVKQAARAFTGYGLAPYRRGNPPPVFQFHPAQHDNGLKTFLGVTKNWDANDVLAALVRHPAHAGFLTTKLFRYFVHDSPSSDTIARLSNTYVSSGFDIRSTLRDMFGGPEFLSPQAYHGVVKQPADYVVGALKALQVRNVGPDLPQALRRMGQDLLNPPDVSGWKTGAYWINSSTLFERFNFANRLATGRVAGKPYFVDVGAQVQAGSLSSASDIAGHYLQLLVDGDATPEARQSLVDYLGGDSFTRSADAIDQKVRGAVHLALSLPTAQLA